MEAQTIPHYPGAYSSHPRESRLWGTKVAIIIKLVVVQGRPQKDIPFPIGEFMFGRGPECHVRAKSDWVSRQHCMLRVTPDETVIRDLGSRNGTLVNGKRLLGEQRLSHLDQLQVGPLVFEVHFNPGDEKPKLKCT